MIEIEVKSITNADVVLKLDLETARQLYKTLGKARTSTDLYMMLSAKLQELGLK